MNQAGTRFECGLCAGKALDGLAECARSLQRRFLPDFRFLSMKQQAARILARVPAKKAWPPEALSFFWIDKQCICEILLLLFLLDFWSVT